MSATRRTRFVKPDTIHNAHRPFRSSNRDNDAHKKQLLNEALRKNLSKNVSTTTALSFKCYFYSIIFAHFFYVHKNMLYNFNNNSLPISFCKETNFMIISKSIIYMNYLADTLSPLDSSSSRIYILIHSY